MLTSLKTQKKSWFSDVISSYEHERDEFINKVNKEHNATIDAKCKIVDEEKNTIVTALLSEKVKAAEIQKDLREKNLSFEGLLPTKVFNELIKSGNFFTFKRIINTPEGSFVPGCLKKLANKKSIDNKRKGGSMIRVYWYAITFILSTMLYTIAYLDSSQIISLSSLIKANIVVSSWSVILILTGMMRHSFHGNSPIDRSFGTVIKIIAPVSALFALFETSRGIYYRYIKYKDVLFPNKRDENGKYLIPISIMQPLESEKSDIQNTLIAWEKALAKPYMVVHKNAFDVSIRFHDMHNPQYKAMPVDDDGDPLYCYDINNFTIIIRQFGKVPAEKNLMEKMTKKYFTSMSSKNFTNSMSLN